MEWVVFVGLLIIASGDRVASIRITRFVVPSVASHGSILDLDCTYDLENDQLYDVKWYKDNDEFYRCKSKGETQTFQVEGVHLYSNREPTQRSCPIVVAIVDGKSAGQYRCEVSTEGPEFKTTARSVLMRITDDAPSKRIEDDDNRTSTPAPAEASTQRNGNRATAAPSSNVINTIMLYFAKKFIIKVV